MSRKIAVIGNSSLRITTPIGEQIVEVLRSYGPEDVFLTRGSGELETFVGTASIVLGRRCLAFIGKGGGDNWQRDQELVDACDEMVAFFDADVTSHSGTARTVALALSAHKPVRAATVLETELAWAAL